MSQSPTSAAEVRKSWRGGPQTNMLRRSRNVWRYILSGFALSLIGLMIWWLIPRPAPRVLLLTFSDLREDRHIIPPVPAASDIEALVEWAEGVNVPVAQLSLSEIDRLRAWATAPRDKSDDAGFTFGTGPAATRLTPHSGDTLVIYVKGHGLALDVGTEAEPDVQPVLVKSLTDAALAGDWLKDADCIVKVGDLLAELAARKGVRTVLVLDAAHLAYDPRLGVLGNGFADAVQKALQKDPQLATSTNVWVLLGSTGGQLSAEDPITGRSALVQALASALERQSGEAKTIRLNKLVQEVAASVSQQPRGPFDALALSPLLIEPPGLAGKGSSAGGQMPELPQFARPAPAGEGKKDAEAVVAEQAGKAVDITAQAAAAKAAQAVPTEATQAGQLVGVQIPPVPPVGGAPAVSSAPPPAATATATTPGTPASPSESPPSAAAPGAAASPPGAAASAPSPTGTPSPASAPAGASPNADPQELQLHLAWQLRDRLLRGAGDGSGESWSPVYLAPHWWRRLEAILVGYDEQVIGSRSVAANDPQTLRLLIGDLQNLSAALSGGSVPRMGPECGEIGTSLAKFLGTGSESKPSQAWQSFQAPRNPGSLDAINSALKTFADCSFRAADYVRLHGRMASITDGGPVKHDLASQLLAQLIDIRAALSPQATGQERLDERRLPEIERLVGSLEETRGRLDADIRQYANSVARPPLSSGKLLRIRLLLESPLLPADMRRELRRAVVQPSKVESSPAATEAASGARRAVSASNMPAANLPARLRDNIDLVRSLIRLAEPLAAASEGATGQINSSSGILLQLTDSKLPSGGEASDLLRWASVGRRLRDYAESLPRQIQNDYVIRRAKLPEPAPADMLGIYLSLQLVDGRDAGRFPPRTPLISLAQPLLPPKIVDRIQLTAEPSQLQLALGEPREGAELKLHVAVQSDSPPPYQVSLHLGWTPPGDVRIVREGTGEEISPGQLAPLRLETGERTLAFRVFPRRQDESAQSAKVLVTATGSFAKAESSEARATCVLPRPNRIDLSVVSNRAVDRAGERLGGEQGGRLMLFPNRTGTYQLFVRNLSSESRKLNAKLYRVPSRANAHAGRLFLPRSPTNLLKQFADLDQKIREATGPVADLAGLLIAQTGEKAPLELSANQAQFVPLLLEAAAPPAAAPPPMGAAGPPKTDVSAGLVLVLSSADGKDLQPYVKWIELVPYLPDDLLEIRRPAYRNGRLSFSVGLKDTRLADELGLAQQPVKIQWDRQALPSGVGEGKFGELLETENREPELWAMVPESAGWPLYIQLHIDDYPRALVSQFERDQSGGVKQDNWKRDRLPAVQIGKLALSHVKTVYEFVPQENWLPFPAPVAQPPEGFRFLPRKRTETSPIIAAIGTQQEIPVTVDLQTDVAPTYFADGAAIVLSLGGRETQRFGFDRRVVVSLAGIDGGGLKLENQVSDWSNLSLPIRVDANQDRRVEIAAEISEGAARSDVSRHRVTLVLDRNAPQITPAEAQPAAVNPATKPRILLRCQANDGAAGSGVERVEFVVGFDQNGNNKLDETERQPPWPASGEGQFYQAEIGLTDDKKEGTYLVEAVATDRAGHREVAPSLGWFQARIPPPAAKNRSSFSDSVGKDKDGLGGKKGKQ